MIWIKNQAGNLINLMGIQGISVHEGKPGEWWLMTEAASGAWWMLQSWPGPYGSKEEAQKALDFIEHSIARGFTRHVVLDMSEQIPYVK